MATMTSDEMRVEMMRDGLIFGCGFVKKDGSFREMVCRYGVTKGVKFSETEERLVQDFACGLITVFDVQADGFRRINLKTCEYVNIHRARYRWDAAAELFVQVS